MQLGMTFRDGDTEYAGVCLLAQMFLLYVIGQISNKVNIERMQAKAKLLLSTCL